MPELADRIKGDWLQRLVFWVSPAFPVGAFSYSHGLEALIEDGLVSDRDSMIAFCESLLRFGDLAADAAFLAHAWSADANQDRENCLVQSAALRGSRELALESSDQGRAFAAALKADDRPYPNLEAFQEIAKGKTANVLPHAVAFGAAARDAGIPVDAATEAWLHGAIANLVSAGQRAIPLGQRDGVSAISSLEAAIARAREIALATKLEEISSSTPILDMASIHHETQYTRLFRS